MKLISKLKNIPEIQIITDYDEYCQSDRIAVKVVSPSISGGIKLELQEFWNEKQIENGIAYNIEQARTEQAFIQESSEFSQELGEYYSFTFSLPANCRISTKNSGWRLEAAINDEIIANLTLKVLPAHEYLAIISAFERKMRFKERKSLQTWNENGVTSFRLTPPEILKTEMDFLYLSLYQEENNILNGTMILKIKEKTVDDYFQNIAKSSNVIRKNFEMNPADLLLQNGEPNISGITEIIAPIIQDVIQKK